MANWCVRAAARSATASLLALAALSIAAPAAAAASGDRDICENKSGTELIRCVEAAARSPAPAAPSAAKATPPAARGAAAGPQSAHPVSREAGTPAPRRAETPVNQGVGTPAGAPKAVPTGVDPATRKAPGTGRSTPHAAKSSAVAAPPPTPGRRPQDCSGRSGEDLRRCLAAGGRLDPALAHTASAAGTRSAPARNEPCEGNSGEALRQCIEARSKREAAAPAVTPSQVIPCTAYTAADRPLCVHRNSAIVECRNRSLYPDFDVCFRSQMANAPEPQRAECRKLPSQARAHCEARNRVFSACTGDRLGYFACLERQLGPDAVLTRR